MGNFERPINTKYQKKVLHDYQNEQGKFSLNNIPKDFRNKLFPFQLDGVKFAIQNFG